MPRGTDAAHLVQDHPGPSGTCAPVGIDTERVNSHTLQAIDQLFPSPCSGLEFLALLLRLAICKQMAMAGMEVADVAEITVQSIRVLAGKIGWSYETTHKYVALFCALGLLIKSRENGLVKLRFPLCRYQPPNSLQRLDELIAKARPKVVSCAKRVKRRFGLLYGKQQIAAPDLLQQTPVPGGSDLQEVLADLRQVMDLPEAVVLRERLKVIEAKLAQLNGRLLREKSTVAAGQEEQNGRLAAEMVDSPPPALAENGRLATETVDSPAGAVEENGRLAAEMVDSLPPASAENGRLAGEKSTAASGQNPQNGRLSGEKSTVSAKTVDSEGAAAANVNVIINTKFERFNDNVREPIEFLRAIFQEPEGKRGYYYNLLKSCAQADIWLAAAVETFLAMQRQTDPVEQPGRYFYDRVIAMHREGLSEEARQLVTRYGGLSYAQLQAVVRNTPSSTPAPAGGSRPRLGRTKPIEPRLARDRQAGGMSHEDLEQVCQEIRSRFEYCAWRIRSYRQEDGTYALLCESPLRRQIWLYRRNNWQARLATLVSPTSAEKSTGGH